MDMDQFNCLFICLWEEACNRSVCVCSFPTQVQWVHLDVFLKTVTVVWNLLHPPSLLFCCFSSQIKELRSDTEIKRTWTYMAAEQIMYQLDFPPLQHSHLHLLSVPCCHGYRVKQHYCKAWPAELRLQHGWLIGPERAAVINDQKRFF